MEVPTPTTGAPTQRTKRPVPDSIKVGIPMSAIGAVALIAMGWVWNTDKAQALDHQTLEAVKQDHNELKADVKQDLKEFRQKLDELLDRTRPSRGNAP